MTIYTVHFRNDAASACEDIEATTPTAALVKAQEALRDDTLDLVFEPYSLSDEVDEITVCDGDEELAGWIDDRLRIRLAAAELLAALEQAVIALNTAPCFEVCRLDSDSYRIAATCDRAIAEAKGGAA